MIGCARKMVHVVFDINSVNLGNFSQTGAGLTYFEGLTPYQRGSGHFAGTMRQRGGGVGDIFRSLWRLLLPAIKTTGKTVGTEGLATGARILNNLSQGANLKDTLMQEGRTGLENVVNKIQKGSGRIKRKRLGPNVTITPNNVEGRSVLKNSLIKRKRTDTFGTY